MKKTNFILGASGIVVLLIGGSILSANHWVDRNQIQQAVIKAIEQKTGRQVTLKAIDIHFFPQFEIEAKHIALSNMEGGIEKQMFTAKHLKANIAWWPLWHKEVEVTLLEMDQLRLSLERTSDNRANWHFSPQHKNVDVSEKEPSSTVNHSKKWDVKFKNIKLDQVVLSWDDRFKNWTGNVFLNQAKINDIQSGKPSFSIQGQRQNSSFTFSGYVDPLAAILNDPMDHEHKPLQFQADINQFTQNKPLGDFHIKGTIADPIKGRGYVASLNGKLLQLNSLNDFFPNLKLPSVHNVTLSGQIHDGAVITENTTKPIFDSFHMSTDAAEAIPNLPHDKIEKISIHANQPASPLNTQIIGKIGNYAASWSGELGNLDRFQQFLYAHGNNALPVKGNLTVGNINTQLEGMIGGENSTLNVHSNLPSFEENIAKWGKLKAQDIRYQGSFVLRYNAADSLLKMLNQQGLNQIELNGVLLAKNVQIKDLSFDHFSTNLSWQKPILTLENLKLNGNANQIAGRVEVNWNDVAPVYKFDIKTAIVPMEWIEKELKLPALYSGPAQIVGTINTQGISVEEQRKNLKGHFGISGVNGQIKADGLRHYMGDSIQSLSMKSISNTRCLALHGNLDKQKIYFDLLTLQTNRFAITGTGEVDLYHQLLNFSLLPHVAFGKLEAETSVKVTGNIQQPQATFAPGKDNQFKITIGSLKDMLVATDYCNTALNTAREGMGGAQPPSMKKEKPAKLLKSIEKLGIF